MSEMRQAYLIYSDWLTVPRVAMELAVSDEKVREWINRTDDPLPARLPPGNKKQVRIYRAEMDAWMLRNFETTKGLEHA